MKGKRLRLLSCMISAVFCFNVIQASTVTVDAKEKSDVNEEYLKVRPRGSSTIFDFEDGKNDWGGRITSTTEVVNNERHSGEKSLKITGRTATFDGPIKNVTSTLVKGKTYKVTTWVKYNDGPSNKSFNLQFQTKIDGKNEYVNVVTKSVEKGQWTLIEGEYSMPDSADLSECLFYIEVPYKDTPNSDIASPEYDLMDFYIDDVAFTEVNGKDIEEDITALKDIFEDSFIFGTAVPGSAIHEKDPHSALIKKHYGALVAENEMKIDAMQPSEGNFQFEQADKMVKFAEDNDMEVRGHTLVWHSQVPEWFFLDEEGEKLEADNEEESNLLLARMKSHIDGVAGRYKGRIHSWDVVNEVLSDNPADKDGLRYSNWATIVGDIDNDGYYDDYIEEAFKHANEVDPQAKLIINDYGIENNNSKTEAMYQLVKRMLEKGVPVDGIGMQMHISMYGPNIETIKASINKFLTLKDLNPDFTVQITELDVSIYNGTESYKEVTPEILLQQAYRYKELFELFEGYAETGDIDMVMVWGSADDSTWLNDFPVQGRPDAPLLFDRNLKAKPAYWILVDPSNVEILRNNANAVKATPILDETVDSLWKVTKEINVNNFTKGDGGATAGVKALWDENNIYLLAEVKDNSFTDKDCIEFYVDSIDPIVVKATDENVIKTDNGYIVQVAVPKDIMDVREEGRISFDVRVNDYSSETLKSVAIWNDVTGGTPMEKNMGYLNFKGATTITKAVFGTPEIDGKVDEIWSKANIIKTEKFSEGINGATAEVKTLWDEEYLYVLANVTDELLNKESNNAHEQDSVEIFIDINNRKTSQYDEDDAQYRINFNNEASFNGACDKDNFKSEAIITEGGYLIEVAIPIKGINIGDMLGFDFQVNDADESGKRVAVSNWFDVTGRGWAASEGYGNISLEKEVVLPKNNAPIINAKDSTLYVGDTFNPKAGITAMDEEDGDLTNSIEVIENTVNTKKAGEYKVVYKVYDSEGAVATKEIKVTVKEKVEEPTVIEVIAIKLNKSSFKLSVGKTYELKANIEPKNATNKDVIWETSNEKVATVNNNGKVKAITEGKATITVTTKDRKIKSTCEVEVTKAGGVTLPQTGGMSITMILIFGSLISGIGYIIFKTPKCRKR